MSLSARRKMSAKPSGYVPGWGMPVWRDETTNRKIYGVSVDPARWNVRGTEVNNLDYATIDPSQVSVDAAGILHIKAEWLASPIALSRGGNATATASDNVVITASAHALSLRDYVYVEQVSGTGIEAGYYYIKSVASTTQVTLTTTCDMWPGDLGSSILAAIRQFASTNIVS